MNQASDRMLSTSIHNISPLMTEILRSKSAILFSVTGNSMYPFLRHCVDSVQLVSPEQSKLTKGKIVLTFRQDGVYVLHRIIKVRKDKYYILGDAQNNPEGPFSFDSVVATVKQVHRNGKVIDTNCFSWRFLSHAWLMLLPFRYFLIRLWHSRCVRTIRARIKKIRTHF